MKIFIRTDGKSFFIPVPNGLIPFALRHAPELASGDDDDDDDRASSEPISRELAQELARELRRARRDFGHLEIVHVLTADGDEVIITL